MNTAWLTLGQGITTLAALFVTGYVANRLGTASYGEMELSVAFANFFSPVIFAGIQIPLIKAIIDAPARRGEAFGDALLIRLVLAPVFVGLVLLTAPLVIPNVRSELVWLAIAYTFLVFYTQSLTVPIEAAERMRSIGIGTILMTVVGMALSIVVVIVGMGPDAVLGARIAGMIACVVYLVVVLSVGFYRPRFKPDLARYKALAKRGVPLASSFLLGLVLLEVDKVMLPHFMPAGRDPNEAVGLYQSATVLAYKFEMIIIPFTTAFTPPLVAALAENPAAFQGLLGRGLRLALILGLPIAVGTGFVAVDITDFIFGEEFLASAPTLAMIIWFVPLQFLNRVLAVALAVNGRERWVALAVGAALATNIAANVFLIPRFEILGAAIATVASEGLLTLIYLIVIREHLFGVLKHLKLARVALAVTAMGAVCVLISRWHMALIIAIAVAVYAVAVLGLRCVTRDEIKALRG
jgi:O-antigen/teichoic acid export membrane protein